MVESFEHDRIPTPVVNIHFLWTSEVITPLLIAQLASAGTHEGPHALIRLRFGWMASDLGSTAQGSRAAGISGLASRCAPQSTRARAAEPGQSWDAAMVELRAELRGHQAPS